MFVGPMNSAQIHYSLLTWSTTAVEVKKKKGENANLKHKRYFGTIQTTPEILKFDFRKKGKASG